MLTGQFTRLSQSQVLFNQNGEDVFLFTLKNKNGVEVRISNLGAIIQSFIVPDSSGNPVDIVLGLEHIADYLSEEYIASKTYLGAIIGRYANRIANACFEMQGQKITVGQNLPPHQLHGGIEGFDRKVWNVINDDLLTNGKLTFFYTSPDGEEGFPGKMDVYISFELTEENELIIYTKARTDKPGPVNLTHHDYFNLTGGLSIDDHWVEIPSVAYLSQNEDYVPDGRLSSVEGNQFDFRQARQCKNASEGYDQSFVLDKDYGSWGLAARCYSKTTGISLEVYTDEPTVHFYTGKHLNIKNGKNGNSYSEFGGLCFETQHHTNAVNIPGFPSTILYPGEVYEHKTLYRTGLI